MKGEDITYLGEFTISDSWDNVTLKQFSDYVRYVSELKEGEMADSVKIIEIFSNIPKDTILKLPVELFDKLLVKLTFLNEKLDIEKEESKPDIVIDGETYQINYMESLKVHEHLDVTTVLDSDKYNYPTILAILCRKPNEEYDDDFIAKHLDKRIEMFNNLNVKEAQKLINFFLLCNAKYVILSQNSMKIEFLKEEITELVKLIETSLKVTDYITPSKWKVISQLSKCKKHLKSI